MPLEGIPAQEFQNRDEELAFLRRLADLRRDSLASNVLLLGGRGAGKTELLKQLHRHLFWDRKDVVPFYYSFKTAALKGATFARDYHTRFIKQYIAFVKKEPLLAGNVSTPLQRLMPVISECGLDWMLEGIDDFQGHAEGGDLYGQILAAVAAPAAAAARGGRAVIVMLDDFTAAGDLHEAARGDAPGLASIFEESMKDSRCPHIVTGSPASRLETLFSDTSLYKNAERLRLAPLPDDAAAALFTSLLEKIHSGCDQDAALTMLRKLRGNPLYIRNMVKAAGKTKMKHLAERDLLECYCTEVMDGETSFYWSSVLNESIRGLAPIRTVLGLLMHRRTAVGTENPRRLSQVLGIRDSELGAALDVLDSNDLRLGVDPVFDDVIQARHLRETGGKSPSEIRERIAEGYSAVRAPDVFEMVIPMTDQAELVAARAVDQIGRNINLEADFMQYIQLALVECCINAIEHSGSHDRRIYLTCITSPETLEIMIESPGRPFSLASLRARTAGEKLAAGEKRGWGFTLMRKILDEVRVDRVNDRTRVTLIKHIKKNEVRS